MYGNIQRTGATLTERAKNARGNPKLTRCLPRDRRGEWDAAAIAMPRKKMTFGEGARKRHKGRYYFSGWLGVGSDSELMDEDSYNPPPNLHPRPGEVRIPAALVGAVGAGPDDPAYDKETAH